MSSERRKFVSTLNVSLQPCVTAVGSGSAGTPTRFTRRMEDMPVTEITPERLTGSKGPPLHFEKTPVPIEVKVGDQAELQCVFSSCFPVASCWMHNKHQVDSGSRIQLESSSKGSKVVISEARPEDAGSYTIVVHDQQGSIKHTTVLRVIDRPQPPASAPVISQLSSTSVVLSWSGPCYDGGSALIGYIVEVKREFFVKAGDWSQVSGCCKSTSFRVQSGLEPEGTYSFRVRACNAVGISEPSEVSESINMDLSPSVAVEESYTDVIIDSSHKVADYYNVLERLGVGKFGQVFRLTQKETGRVCAGKFYKARLSKEKEVARKEIMLMNCLHHPKLVQCLGAYESRAEIVMVMEFIAGGELFERIVDDHFEHTEPTCMQYMQQILEGVQYMHQQNIVHLDLKPENIVCVDSTGTLIKIIDFGLASKLDPRTALKVMHGTPEFVAPEVISFEAVGLATDMWSIGVICYILLSGESPFQGENATETLALVTAACWEFDEGFEDITVQAKDFISLLLKKDMRHRLSCDQALAHSWMAAFISADSRATKSLSKEKMKKFLAKQKWKKTGKALLALKRMASLSNKMDGPDSPCRKEDNDNEVVLRTLEEQLKCKPNFTQELLDETQLPGSMICFTCQIQGYPEPEIVWLRDGKHLVESSQVQTEIQKDGCYTLILSNVDIMDSGVYTCKAINSLGEAVSSATLTVEEK